MPLSAYYTNTVFYDLVIESEKATCPFWWQAISKQTKHFLRSSQQTPPALAARKTNFPSDSDVPPPAMDTTALIREVTENVTEMLEEKLSKTLGTLERTALES